jgi:hypothetical protein
MSSGEGRAIEPNRHRNVDQRRFLDHTAALFVMGMLYSSEHRQRLGRIDRLRRQHGSDDWTRIEHPIGVEQQARQVWRAERLAALLRDPGIRLLYVTSCPFGEARRLRPQRTGVQPKLEPGDTGRRPRERLGAIAPAAQRIVDVMQYGVHRSRHLAHRNCAGAI